jgi:hypothetical protein
VLSVARTLTLRLGGEVLQPVPVTAVRQRKAGGIS